MYAKIKLETNLFVYTFELEGNVLLWVTSSSKICDVIKCKNLLILECENIFVSI